MKMKMKDKREDFVSIDKLSSKELVHSNGSAESEARVGGVATDSYELMNRMTTKSIPSNQADTVKAPLRLKNKTLK